jgi:hypothetical protein
MSLGDEMLEAGLVSFGRLLEAEYGLPIAHWADRRPWSDLETLQVSRALDALITAPIADVVAASADEIRASESGARTRRILSDTKIAGQDWEGSWQWELLAGLDNATKEEAGGMVTPADPRMLVLRTRYRSDFITVLAAYLAEVLCGRAHLRRFEAEPAAQRGFGGLLSEAAEEQAVALQQIPGFESASPEFLAGLLFMIERLGSKAFCIWCEDHC